MVHFKGNANAASVASELGGVAHGLLALALYPHHKLKRKTNDHLILNTLAYGCTHWVCIILSRVDKLDGIY